MNLSKNLQTLFFLCTVTLIGCEKSQDLTENPTFIGGNTVDFKADVNGQNFQSSNPQAVFSDGRISLAASNNSGGRISILLNNTVKGVYPVNASGSNLLQYEKDITNSNQLYSSFLSSTPNGAIEVLRVDLSARTISGVFNGTISQSSLLVTNPEDVRITNGVFQNVPFTNESASFNFGGMNFEENGQPISMNTATANNVDGSYNGSIYSYMNFSTATADFAKSIAIELDDDRYREGVTTYFGAEDTDPFSGTPSDSLASVSYSLNLMSGNPTFYDGISGSIAITKIETVNGQEQASATFNFVGKDDNSGATIRITNGSFSAIFR